MLTVWLPLTDLIESILLEPGYKDSRPQLRCIFMAHKYIIRYDVCTESGCVYISFNFFGPRKNIIFTENTHKTIVQKFISYLYCTEFTKFCATRRSMRDVHL